MATPAAVGLAKHGGEEGVGRYADEWVGGALMRYYSFFFARSRDEILLGHNKGQVERVTSYTCTNNPITKPSSKRKFCIHDGTKLTRPVVRVTGQGISSVREFGAGIRATVSPRHSTAQQRRCRQMARVLGVK
jgi:hypothetical protein